MEQKEPQRNIALRLEKGGSQASSGEWEAAFRASVEHHIRKVTRRIHAQCKNGACAAAAAATAAPAPSPFAINIGGGKWKRHACDIFMAGMGASQFLTCSPSHLLNTPFTKLSKEVERSMTGTSEETPSTDFLVPSQTWLIFLEDGESVAFCVESQNSYF